MKPFDKKEYNRLCAELLGGYKCSNISEQYELPKFMTFQPKNGSNLCHTAKVCMLEDMLFDSDWNWIMEVVEKIQEIVIKADYEFCIEFYQGIYNEKITYVSCLENIETEHSNPKKAVVKAIWQFFQIKEEE
jgi:hypothetical protein